MSQQRGASPAGQHADQAGMAILASPLDGELASTGPTSRDSTKGRTPRLDSLATYIACIPMITALAAGLLCTLL
jgi:hypothetical protein